MTEILRAGDDRIIALNGIPYAKVLAAWLCAFRLENLRWYKDWHFFDEGLTHIEGKIQ